jgi:4-hydroxy-3-polyprenylbenzoate decarboxylase
LTCLKEGRPLVLVPRETPFSLPNLRNLTSLAEAGAAILPASPAFYYAPKNIQDLADFIAGKILDRLSIEHNLYARWKGQDPI